MNHRRFLALPAALAIAACSAFAAASTGVCDSNPPTSTSACIAAIQANGGVHNDIFHDSNGLTAQELPIFGKVYNAWPGCDVTTFAGCSGQSNSPFDCPGQYVCNGLPNSLANAATYANALDRLWWQPCRMTNHDLVNGCPAFGQCITDGVGDNYLPWEGLVFDLGGPSNKVAIFAENDHGPQPCESIEYTVFLSDNPLSKEIVIDPKATGVDPLKWNRAVLSDIYTKGFVEVRPPDPAGHAACGDTPLYSVEEDSFVSVYALPCGITFRYAAIVAGNDGLDFPECQFHSSEAELDAIAGLTESGSGVCPDADGDHFVDCKCPGAPPVCDCNDQDPTIHPGAPESCDSSDVNCDGVPGSCPTADLVCYQSLCLQSCDNEQAFCPTGLDCTATPKGTLCVPQGCAAGCPAGQVCSLGMCVPACTDVSCPGDQICQDGQCIDPCANIMCPMGETCQKGKCVPPCGCYAQDSGCAEGSGTVCDPSQGICVPPACAGKMCMAGEVCDAADGTCKPFCNDKVHCPQGQQCVAPKGCVPLCDGVMCMNGEVCNPGNGKCEDHSCDSVMCFAPEVCVAGKCMNTSGSGGTGGDATTGSGAAGSTTGTGGSATGGAGTGGNNPGSNGTCGCRTAGRSGGEGALSMLAIAAMLAAAQRRRRRSN